MLGFRRIAAALCLVLLALPVLGGCGGGECFIIGEVLSVSEQEAAIRPLTPDEMEGVPYRKELKDVEQIVFSTESLDDFGAGAGDIVNVMFLADDADDFPTEPVSQLEVVSWAPYPPEE